MLKALDSTASRKDRCEMETPAHMGEYCSIELRTVHVGLENGRVTKKGFSMMENAQSAVNFGALQL